MERAVTGVFVVKGVDTSAIPDNTPAATSRCCFHFFTPNMWRDKINSRQLLALPPKLGRAGWKQRAKHSVIWRLFGKPKKTNKQ